MGGAMVRAVASHQYGQVQIPASTAYVDRVVCQWFSPLPWEVFLWVLRLSPPLKNQQSQIPILSGNR